MGLLGSDPQLETSFGIEREGAPGFGRARRAGSSLSERAAIYNREMEDLDTIARIKRAAAAGEIPSTFTPADVNAALGIDWAGFFLAKHRVGNLGGYTELFVQLARGVYRLSA